MTNKYEKPVLRELGSLSDMTEQSFNKLGNQPDLVTVINADVIGSFVPVGP